MPRLTEERPTARTFEHLDTCHICGERSYGDMRIYRECDENDQPIAGPDALLVTCAAKACEAVLEKHPRLYVDVDPGEPGHFRRICLDCPWRRGVGCAHPHLTANGGRGLKVTVESNRGVFLCGPDGAIPIPQTAVECEGRRGGPAAIGGGGR